MQGRRRIAAGLATGLKTATATATAGAAATVLLAPACSALDVLRDDAARGDAFAGAVLARTAGSVRWH